ncbi:hypothetical protein BH20CHL6_BH20CHL6_12680 [soil metagenome]
MIELVSLVFSVAAPLTGGPGGLDYVDPGTGSMIIQAVAAGLVGAALMVGRVRDTIFGGIGALLGRRGSRSSATETGVNAEESGTEEAAAADHPVR